MTSVSYFFRVAAVAIAATLGGTLAGCSAEPSTENRVDENAGITYSPDHSPETQISNLADCLQEAGFAVEVTPDNGISFNTGPGEDNLMLSYEKAMDECRHKFGYDKPQEPLSEEQVHEMYHALVKLNECLAEQGLETSSAPTEQKFVDGYISQSFSWDPYDGVWGPPSNQLSEEEYYKMLEICPRPWF